MDYMYSRIVDKDIYSAIGSALDVIYHVVFGLGWILWDLTKVMSTTSYFDLDIISHTDGAQSSRVPTSLPDDPYVAVRQHILNDREEEFLPIDSRVPLTVEEFEGNEPLDIGSPHYTLQLHQTPPSRNGYLRKRTKTKPKRQNRAREQKERERKVKSKPKSPKVNPKKSKVKPEE
ncbi:hypothetical protein Tco_0290211 [Tanacetum coccineum]